MRTTFLLIALLTIIFISTKAQTTVSYSIDANGDDAIVSDYYHTLNSANQIDYKSEAWTIGGTPEVTRSFFKFNTCIPNNAVIQSAYLSLYYAPVNSVGGAPHSSLTSSNESVLQRVTSAWSESTIIWNNKPSTTATDQVILPQSSSGTQDYTNIDVTAMVQQMISPGNNYGFMLKLTNEAYYARMIFASGDNPDPSKHPLLVVTYTVPTFACFSIRIDSTDDDAIVSDYYPVLNSANQIDYKSEAWTIGGTPEVTRSFFKFNTCIPSNVIIQSAYLSLYYAPVNSLGGAPHSSLTSSNESVLQRVTSPWSESTIIWNNRPSTTATDQVILPQSISGTQDYTNIDVTAMVQQMISTGNNYGFMLKLTNEAYYARMIFASGDNPDISKHPKIEICYTIPGCTNLNLKFFIQGYYQTGGTLKKVMHNELVDANPSSIKVDTVLVELHNTVSPYALVETFKGVLQTNGSLACSFSCEVNGNSYYIAVKHRNTIQTWSASPVAFTAATSYDFTTSASQAFGNNMIEIEAGRWAFYTGDINQDTNIDLIDFPPLDSGINSGLAGYYASDLNGDGNVDLVDFPLLDANIVAGIFSKHP